MKNVEFKILQSRSVMMKIGASLTFRSKGDIYTMPPPPLLVPIFALYGLPLSFSQKIFLLATLARLHVITEIRNSGMQVGVRNDTSSGAD